MKYMLLIHHNPNFMEDPPEPMDPIGAEVGRLIDELAASGEWVEAKASPTPRRRRSCACATGSRP